MDTRAKCRDVWLPCREWRSSAQLSEPPAGTLEKGWTRCLGSVPRHLSGPCARPSAAPPPASRGRLLRRHWRCNLWRFAGGRPRKPLPRPCWGVSAGAPPRWSGAGVAAAAHVSMGAGEEPRLGREGLLAGQVVAPQGHGWLLKIVRG